MDKEARIISHFAHALNGDDGALLGDFVYSKDLFIENVHFKREWLSMQGIGAKAVLVNLRCYCYECYATFRPFGTCSAKRARK